MFYEIMTLSQHVRSLLAILVSFSSIAVLAEDSVVMMAHKLNVATAINEVARSMSNEVSAALRRKEYGRVDELNSSLTVFLKTMGNPASSIIIPEIAAEYSAKRKETARLVFQQYRNDISTTRVGAEALKEEMEDFIKNESESQKLPEPRKKESGSKSNPVSPAKERTNSDIPNDPDLADPAMKKSNDDDPSRLTLDAVSAMKDRIADVLTVYQDKFKTATTDLQRKRIASENRADAIKQCLDGIDTLYVELDCELKNSRELSNSQQRFQITFAVKKNSLGIAMPEQMSLELGVNWRMIAEASAGTKFKIKIPVVVSDRTDLQGLYAAMQNMLQTYPIFNSPDLKFEQIAVLTDDSRVVPNGRTKIGRTGRRESQSESDLVSINLGIYAIWKFPIIEWDEERELPEQQWPKLR